MKKTLKFGLQIGIFLMGMAFGFLLTRFSGGSMTGQPNPVNPISLKSLDSNGSEYSRRQPISPDLVKLFPKLITRQGNPKITAIALTFDDGPDLKYTPKILDILKKYNIKATFFVVGTQIQKYPATFNRINLEGHDIGNHSYQHLKIPELSPDKIRYQLNRNNQLITRYVGPHELIFRPPYGALDPVSIQVIGQLGYKIILWTIDSLDWRGLKKKQVLANIIPKLKQGYIVIQHSAADDPKENLTGSLEALPEIIKFAKSRGYRFITISELLKEQSL